MLRYECPACHQILQIREQYLGLSGSCNKCRGRITIKIDPPAEAWRVGVSNQEKVVLNLVAQANAVRILARWTKTTACIVMGEQGDDKAVKKAEKNRVSIISPETYVKIMPIQSDPKSSSSGGLATDAQVRYLVQLGVPEVFAHHAHKIEASAWIDYLKQAGLERVPPTERQIAFLKELYVNARQIRSLRNAGEASRLIDATLKERDEHEESDLAAHAANAVLSDKTLSSLWSYGVPATKLLTIDSAEAFIMLRQFEDKTKFEIPREIRYAATRAS